MRTLLLVESAPDSLQVCADLLQADPEIELQRTSLDTLATALEGDEPSLVLIEPGDTTPDQVAASSIRMGTLAERMVVVGGDRLDPVWVHGWLRAGAYEVLPSPVDPNELDRTLNRAWSQLDRQRSVPEPIHSPHRESQSSFQRLITHSAGYRRLLERARAVASDDRPILLWGEPGTGKGTLAECIHQASSRGHRAFVRVTATELFELLHDPRPHDDASDRPPRLLLERIGVAQGGTLMIGHLDELTVPAQASLLRRVLGLQPGLGEGLIPTGMRVMASVRRSLSADVRRGAYRADLYHHLGLEVLHVPPLRERREDIELLALHALRTWSGTAAVRHIAPEALHHLCSYDYPCNISELETIMELSLRNERGSTLSASSLPSHVRQGAALETPSEPSPVWRTLEEVQAEYVRQVLEHTRGNRSEAARILGISRTGLLCKIRRYGINSPPRDEGGRHER